MKRTNKDYKEWKRYILERHSKLSALVDAVWNSFHNEAERDGYVEHMEKDELNMVVCIEGLLKNSASDTHIYLPLFLDYSTLVGMDISSASTFLRNNWFILENQDLNCDSAGNGIGKYTFVRAGIKRLEIHTENNIIKSVH